MAQAGGAAVEQSDGRGRSRRGIGGVAGDEAGEHGEEIVVFAHAAAGLEDGGQAASVLVAGDGGGNQAGAALDVSRVDADETFGWEPGFGVGAPVIKRQATGEKRVREFLGPVDGAVVVFKNEVVAIRFQGLGLVFDGTDAVAVDFQGGQAGFERLGKIVTQAVQGVALAFAGADGGEVGGLGRGRAAQGVEVADVIFLQAVIPEQGGRVLNAAGVGQIGGGLAGNDVAELAGVGGLVEFDRRRLVGDEHGAARRAGERLARMGTRQVVVNREPVVAGGGGIELEAAIAPKTGATGGHAQPAGRLRAAVVLGQELDDGRGHAAGGEEEGGEE